MKLEYWDMALEERLKQRLLGGAVLVALVVIFVPMLIEEPVERGTVSGHKIPLKPVVESPPPEKRIEQQRVAEPKQALGVEKPETKTTAEAKPASVKDVAPPAAKPTKAAQNSFEHSTTELSRPSPTAWMIQVASLTNEDNAKKLVEQLRQEELPALMEEVTLKGKLHYRVRVGPEVDHRLAEKMLDKIEKTFKLNPKLMRYPE